MGRHHGIQFGLCANTHLLKGDRTTGIEVAGATKQALAQRVGGQAPMLLVVPADFVVLGCRDLHEILFGHTEALQSRYKAARGGLIDRDATLITRACRKLGANQVGVCQGARPRAHQTAGVAGIEHHDGLVGFFTDLGGVAGNGGFAQHVIDGVTTCRERNKTLFTTLGCAVAGAVPRKVDEHPLARANLSLQLFQGSDDVGVGGLGVAQFDNLPLLHAHCHGHAAGCGHVALDTRQARRLRSFGVLTYTHDQCMVTLVGMTCK